MLEGETYGPKLRKATTEDNRLRVNGFTAILLRIQDIDYTRIIVFSLLPSIYRLVSFIIKKTDKFVKKKPIAAFTHQP